MKSVIFTFNTHNHQPIGNFDNIIEEAYEKSYKPFFKIAKQYPAVKFGTHFTGILLEWLKTHHPEYLAELRQLTERGQLEMISGGYYEPILSVISSQDQQAQIAKLSRTIEECFGDRPRGMWLAERVWEQRLAQVLNKAQIEYVFLDDTHFISAGLNERDLTGYYLTEDEGKTLAVFPIAKALRYTMPFAPVDDTIKVLKDAASEAGNDVICFADDGEKFGVWPETYKTVYGEGWLEEFFAKINENRSWINVMHASEVIDTVRPVGRIYLPNASYAEMMQWALPSAEAYQNYEDFHHSLEEDKTQWGRYMQFVRGGYWRNFFAKYHETNHLHKRVLRASNRVQELSARIDRETLAPAYDAVLAAECNDPYWHGVFGGIYLNNLRHANYSSLIKAETLLDKIENRKTITISEEDFNSDGEKELIVETDTFAIYFDASQGGMITEIDYKPRHFNALNIVNRRKEAYHAKLLNAQKPGESKGAKSIHDMVLTKEVGLEKLLVYDWYRHGSHLDHFLAPGTTFDEVAKMTFQDHGDLLHAISHPTHISDGQTAEITFDRKVSLGARTGLRLTKRLSLTQSSSAINVAYRFTNESSEPIRLRFAPEWCFNLLAGDAHDRYYRTNGQKVESGNMRSSGELPGSTDLELVDEWLKLSMRLRADAAASFWRFPIETVSLSEAGFERVYQGSVIWPLFDIQLGPQETVDRDLIVDFIPLE